MPNGAIARKLFLMSTPRAKMIPEELTFVLSHYDLGIIQGIREFPRGSHSAAKVVVTTNRGKFLIKRRPMGKSDPYRVAFSHSLQRYLASKNFPLPHLIGTREQNNSMLKIEEAIYEAYEFVEAGPYKGGLVETYEAGKTLGIYHNLVSRFRSEWTPPLGHYHDTKMVYEAFEPIAHRLAESSGIQQRRQEIIDLLITVRESYARAANIVNKLGMSDWKTQIVHSDWHPGNMLFDREHVVAVIDYDSARIRPRVMDVANGCLQFSMVTGGRDLTTWPDRSDANRARRFLRGYDEINMLSKTELKAIPSLMQEVLIAQAVQPIMKTGKFARWNGFEFLKVMQAKVQWLLDNQGWIDLDVPEE